MKNPYYDPCKNFHPCGNCPHEELCAAAGLEYTCESFAMYDQMSVDRQDDEYTKAMACYC